MWWIEASTGCLEIIFGRVRWLIYYLKITSCITIVCYLLNVHLWSYRKIKSTIKMLNAGRKRVDLAECVRSRELEKQSTPYTDHWWLRDFPPKVVMPRTLLSCCYQGRQLALRTFCDYCSLHFRSYDCVPRNLVWLFRTCVFPHWLYIWVMP